MELTRAFFVRHQIGLIVTVAFLVISSLFLVAVKQPYVPEVVSALIFLGYFVSGFYLLAVFLHSDSDVATPGSTYPSHYFTLPVRTADLVLWPVLIGLIVVGGTALLVGLAVRGAGYNYDYLTVALVMATTLTAMQAVFWFPFGIAYSKLILSILVIVGIFFIALSPGIWKTDATVQTGLFFATIAVSVGLTWLGVAKARMGQSLVGTVRPRNLTLRVRKLQPPFANPFKAQVWYEWRQQGKALPLITLGFLVLLLIPGFWGDTLSPISALASQGGGAPAVSTYLSVYFPVIIGAMALFSWAVGFGIKRTELRRNDGSFHLFFASRPLSDESLVWAKIMVALKSTFAAWAVLLATLIPLLFTPANHQYHGELAGPAGIALTVLPDYLTPEVLLKMLMGATILVFLTWRNFVIGFWTELSGNIVLRYAQPFLSVAAYVASINVPQRLTQSAEWWTAVLAMVLGLKMLGTVLLTIGLRRKNLVADRSLGWIFAGYVVAVVVLGCCVCSLFVQPVEPGEAARSTPLNPWNFILVTMIFVPIFRILLAVAALSRNRHR